MRSYLDHNATSPLRPSAKAAMLAAMEVSGNASSIHHEGRQAYKLLDEARTTIAQSLGTIAPTVIFTSGGSEANNMALRGVKVERILLSAIEHPSVITAAQAAGKHVQVIPVTPDGVVDLAALEAMLHGPLALVSVMLANNETGVIQPLREVVALAKAHGALVHCDAVQGFGKMPVNFGLLGVDLLTVAPHKVGGPKGIGALIVKDGLVVQPLISGGGQELRRRAGTENLVNIAGFAACAGEDIKDFSSLRAQLESVLQEAVIFGKAAPRLSNTSCFALPGTAAETLLIDFDLAGIALSSGSACSSGKVAPSHVLQAMGVEPQLAKAALRASLGWNTTQADIEHFTTHWQRLQARLNPRNAA